jgi:hypothetical protein
MAEKAKVKKTSKAVGFDGLAIEPVKNVEEKPKEVKTQADLDREVFAKRVEKARKEFVCANPQEPGNNGCGSTKASESATGEMICSKCGWTQPMK